MDTPKIYQGPQMFDEEASQAINPDVHFEWGRGPQGLDPLTFLEKGKQVNQIPNRNN